MEGCQRERERDSDKKIKCEEEILVHLKKIGEQIIFTICQESDTLTKSSTGCTFLHGLNSDCFLHVLVCWLVA